MSNAERTRDMTDAEVLSDLRAQRAQRKAARAELPHLTRWQEALLVIFAVVGVFFALNVIGSLLH